MTETITTALITGAALIISTVLPAVIANRAEVKPAKKKPSDDTTAKAAKPNGVRWWTISASIVAIGLQGFIFFSAVFSNEPLSRVSIGIICLASGGMFCTILQSQASYTFHLLVDLINEQNLK